MSQFTKIKDKASVGIKDVLKNTSVSSLKSFGSSVWEQANIRKGTDPITNLIEQSDSGVISSPPYSSGIRAGTGAKFPNKQIIIELRIKDAPPPIALLINPDSFDIKFQSKMVEQRVRWKDNNGYVFHTTHDELVGISASGFTAMFISEGGITAKNREDTYSWNNINQLIAIYRNNGLNYNSKPGKKSYIDSVGTVMITYDRVMYTGLFNSFGLSENDDQQFRYSFNFDYKVTKSDNIGGMSDTLLQTQGKLWQQQS